MDEEADEHWLTRGSRLTTRRSLSCLRFVLQFEEAA